VGEVPFLVLKVLSRLDDVFQPVPNVRVGAGAEIRGWWGNDERGGERCGS
jgi:hypothetical protein